MTETQRQPVPRVDTGELDTAVAFLRFARECVIKKTDGLGEEQLRRVLVPSGTTLLGLVQHLATSERWWFGYHVAGALDDVDWDAVWDSDMVVPAGTSPAEVLADLRAAVAESEAVVAAVADPEALTRRAVDGQPRTLRWVLAHMTSEVARHAGHADILREQIDGTTGR